MIENNFTNFEQLDFNKSGVLFYPCSGNDIIEPVEMFSMHTPDFWFVDRGYFRPGHQDTIRFGLDLDANEIQPILGTSSLYRRISKNVLGPASSSRFSHNIEPCVVTERYRNLISNTKFNIHLRNGYGVSALRKDIPKISIFFYRGDSEGEGGSGTQWLNSTHFDLVIKKMLNHGLIVTDGSQSCGSKQYAKFSTFHRKSEGYEAYIYNQETFFDNQGNMFECIGYAGNRYGPTLIWKLTKSLI